MNRLFKKYDKWSFQRLSRHLLYWSFWILFYVLANYSIKSYEPLWKWAGFELLVVPVKIACAYTFAYYLVPKFLNKGQYFLFLVFAFLNILIWGFVLYLDYVHLVNVYIFGITGSYCSFPEFIFKAVELIHITSLVISIKFFQNIIDKEKHFKKLEHKKTQAELKYLKNQIQPHFLFNTLNNLYGMILSNNQNAAKSIVKLSDLLSYMIYENDSTYVELEKEIENLENYISLEKLRYHRKLNLDIQITNANLELKIAPMLLLPFVENAFKHGPGNDEGLSKIGIQLKTEGNLLEFIVSNTYSKSKNNQNLKSGVGLKNVRQRLSLLYKDAYSLEITDEDIFKICLRINLNS